jgi:pimeloyl-ACP methyl ester carboxylesterase
VLLHYRKRKLIKGLGYERIDLVGHDIGLMVAYAHAAQYPNEVEKLALLEAPIPGIGPVWEQIYTGIGHSRRQSDGRCDRNSGEDSRR